jgi:hypothetical protein
MKASPYFLRSSVTIVPLRRAWVLAQAGFFPAVRLALGILFRLLVFLAQFRPLALAPVRVLEVVVARRRLAFVLATRLHQQERTN